LVGEFAVYVQGLFVLLVAQAEDDLVAFEVDGDFLHLLFFGVGRVNRGRFMKMVERCNYGLRIDRLL
jgi:hypothetical protein